MKNGVRDGFGDQNTELHSTFKIKKKNKPLIQDPVVKYITKNLKCM